jgi:hypothetical protein
MPVIDIVPDYLHALNQRAQFLDWLRFMPLRTNIRLYIYLSWVDLNKTTWSETEIDSLRVTQEQIDAGYPK